jgi:hypothetical protein
MYSSALQWLGAILMLTAMCAALRADGRPIDLSSAR